MATSIYFQKSNQYEQALLDDLTVEIIKINGIDVYYLPRTLFNQDQIFEESVLSSFNRGHLIEMYVKSVDGFNGEKDILSKYGVEIREQITFVVSRRRYEEEIGPTTSKIRPLEGDLIYLPINKGLYEIKFVEHDQPFYQLGNRYVYELKCEKFEYSSEKLDTGIEAIDSIETKFTLDTTGSIEIQTEGGTDLIAENGDNLVTITKTIESQEPGAQNEQLKVDSNVFINFSEKNPFSEGV